MIKVGFLYQWFNKSIFSNTYYRNMMILKGIIHNERKLDIVTFNERINRQWSKLTISLSRTLQSNLRDFRF